MRIYGYANRNPLALEVALPAALAEITLCATPAELRKIGVFLEACAKEMERMGPSYSHVHLSDRLKEFASSPQLVVAVGE